MIPSLAYFQVWPFISDMVLYIFKTDHVSGYKPLKNIVAPFITLLLTTSVQKWVSHNVSFLQKSIFGQIAPKLIEITSLKENHTLIVVHIIEQILAYNCQKSMNRSLIFSKSLYQNNWSSGNNGPSKIKLLRSYEVLWIYGCEPNCITRIQY